VIEGGALPRALTRRRRPSSSLQLSDQAKGVSQADQWPRGRENDQPKKEELDGNTGAVALRKSLAHKAKRTQAHRSFRIKQLTVPAVAA